MRKFILLTFVLFFALQLSGFSQTLNLRFNNYFYTWKTLDEVPQLGTGASYTTHLKGYQNLAFDLNMGKWTVSSFIQTDEDVVKKIDRGFSYRFYDATIKGTNLFNALDLKLGRQYISAGSGKGTIEGLNFKLKFGKSKEYQITGYGGYLTPLAYDFKGYNYKLKENFLTGGLFQYYGVKDLSVGLSYAMKQRALDPYYTLRADELFNTKTVYIETESKAEQYGGIDVAYRLLKKHNFYAKAYYDINRMKFQKGEFNANIAINDKLHFTAGYFYKVPQIAYNSIFWVFEQKKYQEIEGGLDYTTNFMGTNLNVYGRFGGVFYDASKSLKFQLGVSSPWYGIGITKYTGYAGESEGAFAYFNKEMIKSLLTLTSSLNYSRYNLGNENVNKTDVFGGMLGLTYRPSSRFTVDAQGQMMTNEIYKFDTRFMVGFNYWLFTKFK
jgi:hypothetical protein